MENQVSVILNQLKESAKTKRINYPLLLRLFCQEEFLRRLSRSRYAENLILRGGMLVYYLSKLLARATANLDFLVRQLPDSTDLVKSIFIDICQVATDNAWITFSIKSINRPAEQQHCSLQVQLEAVLLRQSIPLTVDLGFKDLVFPRHEKLAIPAILPTFDSPSVSVYTLESVVAEKYDVVLAKMEFSNRMQDFFDLYYLAANHIFYARTLQAAIVQTLKNRGTIYGPDTLKTVVSLADSSLMNRKWRAYLKQNQLTAIDFQTVLCLINEFLGSIFDAIVNQKPFLGQWDYTIGKWQ